MRYKPMVNKIKAYLEEEVRITNKWLDHIMSIKGIVDVDDSDVDLCRGRAECAEGLLNEIKKWENE